MEPATEVKRHVVFVISNIRSGRLPKTQQIGGANSRGTERGGSFGVRLKNPVPESPTHKFGPPETLSHFKTI